MVSKNIKDLFKLCVKFFVRLGIPYRKKQKTMRNISKSKFLSGVQCEKKLFFDTHRSDLKPPISPEQQASFDVGHKVGFLAQAYFPGGMDATPDVDRNYIIPIANTRRWINEGVQTIYEATFSANGVFAALDILHHHNGERWAIEVKSSTSVKDYHITDASLQYFAMSQAGFAPDRFFLMHINNRYVKNGEIDPKEFFVLEELTDKVLSNQPWVEKKVNELRDMLEGTEPTVEIGPHCGSPFSCDYKGHCWRHIPDNSVFDLYNSRGKEWNYYNNGILDLRDIPDLDALGHRQRLQVEGQIHGQRFIDEERIEEFSKNFQFPLYFFDFETIFTGLPILDGTRPYQQVPFQYSLHILSEDGTMEHREFLATAKDFNSTYALDPRKQLIQQLRNDIGATGSIVAYNASFEIAVLNGLADTFKEDSEFLYELSQRFVDLLVPFQSGWYYLPEMGASASIKSVLPAIAPEFSYDDLVIGNGGDASAIFHSMITGDFTGDVAETRHHLLAYCERDTLGMVIVWKEVFEDRV
jgi:hypothetical protein